MKGKRDKYQDETGKWFEHWLECPDCGAELTHNRYTPEELIWECHECETDHLGEDTIYLSAEAVDNG